MRYSKTLIPTVKEVPADAEIPSHQLMIRAGLMRKLASGTYIYLPAGQRMLAKVMQIVREEMNRTGAQEIIMPVVQPLELWQQTGRDIDYGQTLGTFVDRHGRGNVLSPTAEEGFTYLAAGEIKSYKQLPMNLYQINTKYRDEFRPRFGVLRSREFIMKDAYSFHTSEECLHKTYMDMYHAYCRVFERCGLEYVIVLAESGEMGGTGSHQFTVPCASGEDIIVYTADNRQAWNIEKAPVDPLPKQPPVPVGPVEDFYTPKAGRIDDACAYMKVKPHQLIKTLIYKSPEGVILALVRGDHEVNTEKLTRLMDGAHIEMADEAAIVELTGAAVGFAGPVGLCGKAAKVFIDYGVAAMAVGATGANKTDYHIMNVVPGRDFPLEGAHIRVADIRNAVEGDTFEGKKLLFKRGIEVGQVFKLGDKYTRKLDVKYVDADGKEKYPLMGCYGIGINRIIASAIEIGHDKDGMILPITIAPWEVIVTPAGQEEEVTAAAERIYQQLLEAGVEVLLDDRDIRAGVKFKDADLLGIPIRITIGKKTLAEGRVECKRRCDSDCTTLPLDTAAAEVAQIVSRMKDKLNAVKN
ncbi:MAG TPA: proline--tRNA ligase [Anaerohalosphaeraceae bacterium]|nr:proline--tRNA ligase [Anaerohalosphaeraceae bacterium]HOM76004.1 proline--tRNA ligase [Anaerohalosphaeraceae bacterium]HPC64588.1 proline--tRNA ligase [Anaerohalosphaeraceae bacterium]HPO70170.1 proline--tRNA ligase [Anaerohalosphaeraceae bacterium]HRS71626.1 proline--tRNA ligase [Anaerohalosphaeraceae bacterium]